MKPDFVSYRQFRCLSLLIKEINIILLIITQNLKCRFRFLIYVLPALPFFLASCKKEISCVGCIKVNLPPIARAEMDKIIIPPQDSTVLDGRFSFDPDGKITGYQWAKVSGPASFTIANPTQPQAKVLNLTVGIYRFELKVTDNNGVVARDTVLINVTFNRPPIFNAGPDQTITLPFNSTTLDDGNSFDPDQDIAAYLWARISGPFSYTINDSYNSQTQLSDLIEGIYRFELKVTDAGGLISKDTVMISVFMPTTTEHIFNDQRLFNTCYDPSPGMCWINGDTPSYGVSILDTGNVLPDTGMAGVYVWVKMDTSAVWECVAANCWQFPDPTPQTNFTYCLSPGALTVWS